MFLFQDKPLSPDLQTLLDAVALLDISEFRLFELAYRAWYGNDAGSRQLEQDFADYMFCDEVPIWVRHYARGVVKQAALSQSGKFPYPPKDRPADSASIRRGLRVLLGLIFILVFLIVVSSLSPEWLQFGNECYFPPCY
ncbi:MAG: hypothetical protein RI563_01020 [Thiohalophilus sp.]|uniref:hypothetical protein n=1 Tax=Thiohalophilus sp. TaxID=3028392 RepID=UPI00286FD0F0|nr:hypothetical protein [Thiohalophilus sp.]MDR9435428.1 hypothetical protein [Thiohalophilus sp.]